MSSLKTFAMALLGATAIGAAAAPAFADTVTMQARFSGDPGATNSADYVNAWNAVLASQPTPPPGYANQVIADWNGNQSNCITGGGVCGDLAYHDRVVFDVDASHVGNWAFRFGIDFGFGGTFLLDGAELDTNTNDMWWGQDFSFPDPSQYLKGSASLAAGTHVIDLYGFEGCCDGGTIGQYFAPNTDFFQDFRTTAPEPVTWSLMILGFGAAGAMLRRARVLAAA